MHPFDSVLNAMELESSLFVHLSAGAPWGISFNSGYKARLLIVTRGKAWFTSAGSAPVPLTAGHCLIIKEGTDCALMDAPGAKLVSCTQVVERVTGAIVQYGGAGERCEFISVRLSFDDAAAAPLIALLPNVVHVKLDDPRSSRMITTLGQIGAEEAERGFGTDFVIARLIEILFAQVLRAWTEADGSPPPGWLAGLKHQRLGVALRSIHRDLPRRWTVGMLAGEAGMSRSAFADLFKSVVGVAPLAYIAGWRIYRAKASPRSGSEKVK